MDDRVQLVDAFQHDIEDPSLTDFKVYAVQLAGEHPMMADRAVDVVTSSPQHFNQSHAYAPGSASTDTKHSFAYLTLDEQEPSATVHVGNTDQDMCKNPSSMAEWSPPRDYFNFAALVMFFCCCPLGLWAVIKAYEVQTLYAYGNPKDAVFTSRIVLLLAIMGFLIGVSAFTLGALGALYWLK